MAQLAAAGAAKAVGGSTLAGIMNLTVWAGSKSETAVVSCLNHLLFLTLGWGVCNFEMVKEWGQCK